MKSTLRLWPLLAISVVVLGFIMWAYPAQIPIISRKVAVTIVGLWVGYAAYKLAFPRDPEDDVSVLTVAKVAMMIGTALCIVQAV